MLAAAVAVTSSAAPASAPGAAGLRFEDVTEAAGLTPHLKNWQLGHGGGWGDVNDDGRPDLYIGAFAEPPRWKDGPLPNMLFLSRGDGFVLSPQKELQLDMKRARTSNVILADLDNDGDLDIVNASHASTDAKFQSVIWENRGHGQFKDSTPAGGYWPRPMGLRNTAVYDMDGDGLLDIIGCDGNYSNWKDGRGKLLVLMNRGGFTFADGSADFGFPPDGTVGLGLAVGDVNNDGRFDFFVADSNRLFVSDRNGKYLESQNGYFAKPTSKEGHTCGAAFGDLNGDGLLDLVTTEHGQPAKIHIYTNRRIERGLPVYEDVTATLGLADELPSTGMVPAAASPAGGAVAKVGGESGAARAERSRTKAKSPKPAAGTPVKAAHVALRDFDNDGRLDVFISIIWRDSEGRLQPLVLRNLGNRADGLPRFTAIPMDRLVGYYAPAPVTDFDRDGRMDIFTVAWFEWEQTPSILFRNTSASGHWLEVQVTGSGRGLNTMGVGSIVRIYEPGQAGKGRRLLGRHDMAVGTGYASGEEALAHFGLGQVTACDVEITWAGKTVVKKAVKADQLLKVDFAAETKSL